MIIIRKYIFKALAIFLMLFCAFTFTVNVEATGEEITITLTNGASIRQTPNCQGLKFNANINSTDGVTEHGFYVALEEHTIEDMTLAINSSAEIVGSNKLIKKPIISGADDLDFNLIIVNFPIDEEAYCNQITVIAYAVVGEVTILSASVTTRSIGDVAMNMQQSGETGDYLDKICAIIPIKHISFETDEGFVHNQSYSSTYVAKQHGPENEQWDIVEGSVSKTNAIAGELSIQLRDYLTNTNFDSITAYAVMDYTIDNVSYVKFDAKNCRSKTVQRYYVKVSYSVDDGKTWQNEEVFDELNNSVKTWTYVISDDIALDNVKIRFDIIDPVDDVNRTENCQLIIDDIKFYTLSPIE